MSNEAAEGLGERAGEECDTPFEYLSKSDGAMVLGGLMIRSVETARDKGLTE